LIRVSFGPFQLGELAEGAVEEIPTRVLREQLGERLVALSGVDFSTPVAPRRSESKEQRPARPQKKPDRAVKSHSWRGPEEDRPAKKLQRKFHGTRRDDTVPREHPARDAKRGKVVDRKGRSVALERYGEPPERKPQAPWKSDAPRRGQRPRFGKGRGNPRRR
jgi:23S rRNA pseudouridine2605 synthase